MIRTIELPTQEELHNLFKYKNGDLIWKVDRHSNKVKGTIAGRLHNDGYILIKINSLSYKAHRIIWKMFYDEEPPQIDHRNGNRSDNDIDNLRPANHSQQMGNQKGISKTGFKGVCKHRDKPKRAKPYWAACAGKYIGTFTTAEKAAIAYNKAAKIHFGDYALLNKIG